MCSVTSSLLRLITNLGEISLKNLANAPAHLQCIVLCLQGYDLILRYWPGYERILPDTLSWYAPEPSISVIQLNLSTDHITSLLYTRLLSSKLYIMICSCIPLQRLSWMAAMRTSNVSHAHFDPIALIKICLQFRTESSYMEKPLLFHHCRGKIYSIPYTKVTKALQNASC